MQNFIAKTIDGKQLIRYEMQVNLAGCYYWPSEQGELYYVPNCCTIDHQPDNESYPYCLAYEGNRIFVKGWSQGRGKPYKPILVYPDYDMLESTWEGIPDKNGYPIYLRKFQDAQRLFPDTNLANLQEIAESEGWL